MAIDLVELTALLEKAVAEPHGYYTAVVTEDDVELIRRCGRAAGRRAGVKIRTVRSAPHSSGLVEVWVGNVEPIDPSDEVARRRLLQQMRAATEAASEHLEAAPLPARTAAKLVWGVDPTSGQS